MFAAYALEYADPPGLSSYGLQGPPPDVDGILPWRGFVESRGSGSKWTYIVISPLTGRWSEEVGTVTDGSPLDTLTRTTRRSWDGSTLGTSAIDWQPEDGTLKIYANPIADYQDSLNSTNRGTSAPAWAVPGTKWEDTTGAPTAVLLKIMDAGGDWITLGTLNETANTFTPTGLDGVLPLTGGTLSGALVVGGTAPQVKATGSGFVSVMAETTGSGQQARFHLKQNSREWAIYSVQGSNSLNIHDLTSGTDRVTVSTAGLTTINGTLAVLSAMSLAGSIAIGDANFNLVLSGSNPLITYASGDDHFFDRSVDAFVWRTSGANRLIVTPSAVTTGTSVNLVLGSGAALLTNGGAVMVSANGTLGTTVFTLATRPSAAANNWRIILVSDASGSRFLNISNTSAWHYPDGTAA